MARYQSRLTHVLWALICCVALYTGSSQGAESNRSIKNALEGFVLLKTRKLCSLPALSLSSFYSHGVTTSPEIGKCKLRKQVWDRLRQVCMNIVFRCCGDLLMDSKVLSFTDFVSGARFNISIKKGQSNDLVFTWPFNSSVTLRLYSSHSYLLSSCFANPFSRIFVHPLRGSLTVSDGVNPLC